IPDECYLFEVVLWLAFQRLPIASGDEDGNDIRDSSENRVSGPAGYAISVFDTYIFDEETSFAGIPPDPSWRAALDGTPTLSIEHYDKLLKQPDLKPGFREHLEAEREEAIQHHAALKEWEVHFQRAIEYPASKIFLALRDGALA